MVIEDLVKGNKNCKTFKDFNDKVHYLCLDGKSFSHYYKNDFSSGDHSKNSSVFAPSDDGHIPTECKTETEAINLCHEFMQKYQLVEIVNI